MQIYRANSHFSGGKAKSTVWLFCLCTYQGFHNEEVSHHIAWMERDKSSLTLVCLFFFPKVSVNLVRVVCLLHTVKNISVSVVVHCNCEIWGASRSLLV